MKNLFKSLVVGALLASGAMAQDTTYSTAVQVEVKSSKVEVHKLPRLVGTNPFAAMKVKAPKYDYVNSWQYFAFPIKVVGRAKGEQVPAYVPELDIVLHVRFARPDGTSVQLKKNMTFVNIPLDAGSKEGVAKEVYIGALIAPEDAFLIAGDLAGSKKGDLDGMIEAIAIEAKAGGESVIKPGTKPNFEVGSRKVTENWWKRSAEANSGGAKLTAVNESPYALQYAGLFPQMRPMVAAAPVAAPAPARSARSSSSDDDDDKASSRSTRSSR